MSRQLGTAFSTPGSYGLTPTLAHIDRRELRERCPI